MSCAVAQRAFLLRLSNDVTTIIRLCGRERWLAQDVAAMSASLQAV
jgi:hypothetical protein